MTTYSTSSSHIPVQEAQASSLPLREAQHLPLLASIQEKVSWRRIGLGIESIWTIDVRVLCPEEMPDSEAYIYWHAEVWYARLCIRCDVPLDLLNWLIVHELMELRRWRTTDAIRELLDSARAWSGTVSSNFLDPLWDRYDRQIREMRNQEVEVDTSLYFDDDHRPFHLDGAYVYSNPHGPLNRVQTRARVEPDAPTQEVYTTQPLSVSGDASESEEPEPEPEEPKEPLVFTSTALTLNERDAQTRWKEISFAPCSVQTKQTEEPSFTMQQDQQDQE